MAHTPKPQPAKVHIPDRDELAQQAVSPLTDPDTIADVYHLIKLAQAVAAAIVTTDPTLIDARRGHDDHRLPGIERLQHALVSALANIDCDTVTEATEAMYTAIAQFALRRYTPR